VLADLTPLKPVARLSELVDELHRPKAARLARHAIGVSLRAAACPLARGVFGGARLGDVLGDRKAAARAGARAIGDLFSALGARKEHRARRYHARLCEASVREILSRDFFGARARRGRR